MGSVLDCKKLSFWVPTIHRSFVARIHEALDAGKRPLLRLCSQNRNTCTHLSTMPYLSEFTYKTPAVFKLNSAYKTPADEIAFNAYFMMWGFSSIPNLSIINEVFPPFDSPGWYSPLNTLAGIDTPPPFFFLVIPIDDQGTATCSIAVKASLSGCGRPGFDPQPRHSKDVKNGRFALWHWWVRQRTGWLIV